MTRNILASYDFKTAITVQGLASFNANISAFGTSTFWANQQLSLAVRNGVNAVTNLVQYSKNDTTITGGRTTTGLIWAGTTAMENNQGYGLTTSAYVSTTQATFTTNSAVTQTPFAVGQKLIVAGVTGGTYNGSFIITAIGGSAGAWTATVTSPSGTTPFTNVAGTGGTGSIEPALFVRQPSAGTPALTIKAYGTASGSTEPFRYIDSTGVVKTYIAASGDITAPAISAIWSITSSAQDVAVNAMRTRTSLASGYRANLQTWESSSTVLAGMTSAGKFFTGSTTGINTAVGGTIQSIATGANPLVTMASAHGLAIGDVVLLAGTTGGTYNGTFYVATVPLSTTFTITSALTTGQAAAGGTVSVGAQVAITARSSGVIGQAIRGAASQFADLLQIQDSTGAILAKIDSVGAYTTNSANGYSIAGAATFRSLNSGQTMLLTAGGSVSTNPHVVIRQSTSQTGDLTQWQTSAPTTVTAITSTGNITTSAGISLTGANSPINLPTGGNGTSGQVLTSAGSGATPTWTTVSGGGSFTGGTLTSNLTLAAGTTSLSPLTFQSGTNLTTVTAGANEYDGTVFYQTSNTSPGRALATQNYYYVSSADYGPDFSSSSAVQSMLGAATRGITVAAGTTYEYELEAAVQHDYVTNGGISGTFQMTNTTVSGSPTVSTTHLIDYGSNTTNHTTATTLSTIRTTGSVLFMPSISSGARYGIIKVRGVLRVTGTGTTKIYPGISVSAPAGDNVWNMKSGLIFKMTPIGNGTVTSVGTWA